MKRQLSFFALLLMMLLATSCRDSRDPTFKRAQRVWQSQESLIERAARGERVDTAEFRAACSFFWKVTGISVPGEHSPVLDWYPTKDTGNALQAIRQWYRENGDRLYWDYTTQSVKVQPAS